MIDRALAERERVAKKIVEAVWLCTAYDAEGFTWLDNPKAIKRIMPLLAVCANEALERGREQVLLHLSDELAQEIRDVLKSMDEANAALKAEG